MITQDFTLTIQGAAGRIMSRPYTTKMGAEAFLRLSSTKKELRRKGATRAVITEATRQGPKTVGEYPL